METLQPTPEPEEPPAVDPAKRRAEVYGQAIARLSGGVVLAIVFAVPTAIWGRAEALPMIMLLGAYLACGLSALGVLEAYLPPPPQGARTVWVWLLVWGCAWLVVFGVVLQLRFTVEIYSVGNSPEKALDEVWDMVGRMRLRDVIGVATWSAPLALQVLFARRQRSALWVLLVAPALALILSLASTWLPGSWWIAAVVVFVESLGVVGARVFGDFVHRRWIRWRAVGD